MQEQDNNQAMYICFFQHVTRLIFLRLQQHNETILCSKFLPPREKPQWWRNNESTNLVLGHKGVCYTDNVKLLLPPSSMKIEHH